MDRTVPFRSLLSSQVRPTREPNTDLSGAAVDSSMYEAVRAVPTGESTVARYAATAADYGFDGIVDRTPSDGSAANRDEMGYDADEIRDRYGVDVVEGVEIRATDPSRASGLLGSLRRSATVLMVRGGSAAMVQFAVRQDRVDVLTAPTAGDGSVDFAMAGEAAAHDVRVELDLGRVLRTSGGQRVRAVEDLERLWRVIDDRDVPYVVTGTPASHLQLRAPRELLAVGSLCGIDRGAVEAGLREWGRIATRNRNRLSGRVPSPGVEVVDDRDETVHSSEEQPADDGGDEP